MSPIVYRAIEFKTRLSPESIREITKEIDPVLSERINIIEITKDRETRFRISLTDAATNKLGDVIYQLMNWDSNSTKRNK